MLIKVSKSILEKGKELVSLHKNRNMSEVELEFVEWCIKMNEKLTLIILKMKDHTDISEEDYEILKLWHRSWYLGLHPLYRTQMQGKEEMAVQGGLFNDKKTGSLDGTDIVDELSEN